MLWKEIAEFAGNRRYLRVFALAVLAMGILPVITTPHRIPAGGGSVIALLRLAYTLFAAVVVVAQSAPDLVLHERSGRTLDYLLATRLPDAAIFGAKVFTAAAVGYVSGLAAVGVQLVVSTARDGHGWQWLYLADPIGRVVAFGLTAVLVLYVAVVGTFVALRVGEQRAAYMVTVLSLGVPILPVVLGWIRPSLTASWIGHATLVFGVVALALGAFGLRLFRREMLALYLQE
jgi:hypothetical protein